MNNEFPIRDVHDHNTHAACCKHYLSTAALNTVILRRKCRKYFGCSMYIWQHFLKRSATQLLKLYSRIFYFHTQIYREKYSGFWIIHINWIVGKFKDYPDKYYEQPSTLHFISLPFHTIRGGKPGTRGLIAKNLIPLITFICFHI